MAAAAGAAEAPVLAGFTIALIMVLAWVVLMGLRQTWVHTFSVVLEQLADMFRIDAWIVHIDPLNALRRLDRWVLNQLAGLISLTDGAIGFFFHESARLQGWIADETWQLARDTYHLGGWLVHTYVPTYVHGLTDVLHAGQRVIVKQVTRVEHTTVKIVQVAKADAKAVATRTLPAITIPYLGDWQWLHRHWKALTRAVAAAGAIALFPPTAIPRLWHGIDELRDSLKNILRRLRRVEGLFAVGVFAVVLAETLGVSARCVRSGGPIGKVARRLCGLSTHALEDLLGLIADVVIFTDICKVIDLLNEGLSIIEGPLGDFVSVVGGALCHGDFDAPPVIRPQVLSLPPVTGIVLSLG